MFVMFLLQIWTINSVADFLQIQGINLFGNLLVPKLIKFAIKLYSGFNFYYKLQICRHRISENRGLLIFSSIQNTSILIMEAMEALLSVFLMRGKNSRTLLNKILMSIFDIMPTIIFERWGKQLQRRWTVMQKISTYHKMGQTVSTHWSNQLAGRKEM